MGPELTGDLVREFGPGFTAELVEGEGEGHNFGSDCSAEGRMGISTSNAVALTSQCAEGNLLWNLEAEAASMMVHVLTKTLAMPAAAFGPVTTCQIVRHFGPKLTGECKGHQIRCDRIVTQHAAAVNVFTWHC
jgi:hypothetical protein